MMIPRSHLPPVPLPADIHEAARRGNVEAIKTFLEDGISIDEVDGNTKATPLIYAATEGRDDAVRFLIESGADLNHQNMFGHTALAMAALYDKKESAHLLLEAGANLDLKNQHDETALDLALEKNHTELAEMIKKAPEERSKAAADKAEKQELETRNSILEKQRALKEKRRPRPNF